MKIFCVGKECKRSSAMCQHEKMAVGVVALVVLVFLGRVIGVF